MAEERAKAEPKSDDIALPEPPARRFVLDMPPWLPLDRVPRWLLITAAVVLVLGLIVGTTVPFAAGWLDPDDFETLG